MSKAKFEIVSDCEGCQAITDANALFLVVEDIAKSEDISPHRMARALRELTAIWHAMTIGAFGPEAGTAAEALEQFIADTEASLRYQAGETGQSDTVHDHVFH